MNNKAKEEFKFRLSGKTLVVVDWANVHGWSKSLKWNVGIGELFSYMKSYVEVFEQRFYHGVDSKKEWSCKIKEDASNAGFTVVSKEVKWTPVYLNKQNHFKKVIKELFDVLDEIKITNSDIANSLYTLKDKIEDSSYELIGQQDQKLKTLNESIDELQKNLQEPVLRMKCDFDVEIARDIFNLSNDFSTLVLFSGDGDYSALVEDLVLKGKKVIVVFAPGHKGKEYESLVEEMKIKGLSYRLFMCTVEHLKGDIALETTIPPDFSGGRDKDNVAGLDTKSQESVDNE